MSSWGWGNQHVAGGNVCQHGTPSFFVHLGDAHETDYILTQDPAQTRCLNSSLLSSMQHNKVTPTLEKRKNARAPDVHSLCTESSERSPVCWGWHATADALRCRALLKLMRLYTAEDFALSHLRAAHPAQRYIA